MTTTEAQTDEACTMDQFCQAHADEDCPDPEGIDPAVLAEWATWSDD